jgi:iron uptake system component EfeO
VPRRRRLIATALLLGVVVVAAACGDDDDDTAVSDTTASAATSVAEGGSGEGVGATELAVSISDQGCEPADIQATAGVTTFKVTNAGSSFVTEFEVLQDGRILGEAESVEPGHDRSFTITLQPGSYETFCPGGEAVSRGTLTVTGEAAPVSDQEAADLAVANYLDYVKAEADQLETDVAAFAAAVKAADVDQAKRLFASSRYHYETIEPIAESFGDLDPAIDAREGDVPDADWTGFHRIEKSLFEEGTAADLGPLADQLVADVGALRTQIDSVTLEPAQIATGAVELLNEVSTSKITGEEDRYSHTDLSDFAANVEGSSSAFAAVRSLLAATDAELAADVDARFVAVTTALQQHADTADPVGHGYELYDELTTDDTKALSTVVDALAEPLSQVAAKVAA